MSIKTISLSLVYANGGAVIDYSNLQFAFFAQPLPINFGAPEVTGNGVNITGGLFEITLHTALNVGDTGFLILTNTNGSSAQSPSAIVFAGPVLINNGDRMTTLARNAYSFASVGEFNSFGGAVVYGEGPLWIAGQQYWSNGTTYTQVGGGVASNSGITTVKLAASNTPTQNTLLIQNAATAGQPFLITSDDPIVQYNSTLFLSSEMIIEDGLMLQLAPNSNCIGIKSAIWNVAPKVVSSVTTTTVSVLGSTHVLAVAAIAGHGKAADDYIFMSGIAALANSTASPASVTAGSFVVGKKYVITSVGNTDFVAIGSRANAAGSEFIATGVGAGSGTAVAGVYTDIFNGIFKVYDIPDANTIRYRIAYDVGDTPSNGFATQHPMLPTDAGYIAQTYRAPTMSMRPANFGIKISGGILDFNGKNQTTSDSYNTFGIFIMYCAMFRLNNTKIVGAIKYAVAAANIYDGICRDIELDTNSDGIHWMGGGDGLIVENVYGLSGDDFAVAGQSDYGQYMPSNIEMTNFGTIKCVDINPKQGFSIFKYYGTAAYFAEDIDLSKMGGKYSGGSGGLIFISDPTSIGAEVGVSRIKRLHTELSWDQNSTKAGITFGNIWIDRWKAPVITCGLGNTSGTSNSIAVASNTVIDFFEAGLLDFYAANGELSANACGIRIDGTSVIKQSSIGVYNCQNIGYGILQNNNTFAADNKCVFSIGTFTVTNCNYHLYANGRTTLQVGTLHKIGLTSVGFIINDYCKITAGAVFGMHYNSVTIATGKNCSINAPGLGFDKSLSAGTVYADAGNPGAFYNKAPQSPTAGSLGTVDINAPVMFRNIDSKWVQLTDSTKTS